MFDYQGPVHAQKELRAFMRAKGNTLCAKLAEKLDAAGDELSPVSTCVDAMERLFAALVEMEADGATPITNIPTPAREMAKQTLGALATAVGHGQYHSKGDRAWLIAAWAANELNPTTGDSIVPEVDAHYSFAVPQAVQPLVPGGV